MERLAVDGVVLIYQEPHHRSLLAHWLRQVGRRHTGVLAVVTEMGHLEETLNNVRDQPTLYIPLATPAERIFTQVGNCFGYLFTYQLRILLKICFPPPTIGLWQQIL